MKNTLKKRLELIGLMVDQKQGKPVGEKIAAIKKSLYSNLIISNGN